MNILINYFITLNIILRTKKYSKPGEVFEYFYLNNVQH